MDFLQDIAVLHNGLTCTRGKFHLGEINASIFNNMALFQPWLFLEVQKHSLIPTLLFCNVFNQYFLPEAEYFCMSKTKPVSLRSQRLQWSPFLFYDSVSFPVSIIKWFCLSTNSAAGDELQNPHAYSASNIIIH